jgi:hypothetical protein
LTADPQLDGVGLGCRCVRWAVMGVDTITNLEAVAYSAAVLVVVLARGAVYGWFRSTQLGFIREPIELRFCEPHDAAHRATTEPLASTSASSVAPFPLHPARNH